MKHRIAIFASGGGSNALALIRYFSHHPHIEIALVITNNAQAGVCQVASLNQIPLLILEKQQVNDGAFILSELQKYSIDYIVLAGYLRKIPDAITAAFSHKIINIHPALLPKFGGHGMYGKHVHKAVHHAREKSSGITIHYVNEEYDKGAIIFQASCPIDFHDTPDDIETKVRALEQKYFPVEIEKVILHKKPTA